MNINCIKKDFLTIRAIQSTGIQKLGVGKIYLFFLHFGSKSHVHKGCVYLMTNTVKATILWNIITI